MSWDDEWVELRGGDRVRREDIRYYTDRCGKAYYKIRGHDGGMYTAEETMKEMDALLGRGAAKKCGCDHGWVPVEGSGGLHSIPCTKCMGTNNGPRI